MERAAGQCCANKNIKANLMESLVMAAFSHDVTEAMLVYQANRLGIGHFRITTGLFYKASLGAPST